MATQQCKYLEVDLEGDVELELSTMVFRVSSKVLSSASKVFKAMFLPHFQEGTELARNRTCRIPPPDDDPDAMLALVYIIHHRPGGLHRMGSAKDISKIAMLADQYDCIGAAYFWIEAQISRILRDPPSDEEDYPSLLLATYLVDNADLFQLCTQEIVFRKAKIRDDKFSDMLPTGLIGTLKSYQNFVKRSLCEALDAIVEHLLAFEADEDSDVFTFSKSLTYTAEEQISIRKRIQRLADCREFSVAFHLWLLKARDISPIGKGRGNLGLASFVQKLQNFKARKVPGIEDVCKHCRVDFEELIRECFKPARSAFDGLCLDCVRHGKREAEDERKSCRVMHDGYLGIQESLIGE